MRLSLNPSLTELVAAGVRPRAADAATIARELALRAARGELPGIPSFHVIRLVDDGTIQVEGPVASGREIERAARLLETLLPPMDAQTDVRVPGALRLTIARALRVLDLPPFASLEAFAEALDRFVVQDSHTVVMGLVAAWRAATAETVHAPQALAIDAPLTISDIRRARRATRLTLADISERTRIPASVLREFEWGYLSNWPSGFTGRAQAVRYARAAGLDERVVLSVAVPLLDEFGAPAALDRAAPITVTDMPVPTSIVRTDPSPLVVATRAPQRRARWAYALAIPALLAISFIPAFWLSSDDRPETPSAPSVAKTSPAPPRLPAAPTAAEKIPEVSLASASFSPAFATAGSAVFYHSGRGPGSAIVRADTDRGGAVLRVTRVVDDRASNYHARPSPDGALIAFDSDRDGERGIYVADAEGQDVRRVTGPGFAAVPSWSPDGKTLAFVRAEEGRAKVWNIWTVNLQTGRETRRTSHAVGQPWGAAWFPDGRRVAYSHETRLVVRTLDGERQWTFDSPIRGRMLRTPAVSPDGRRVMFQVYKSGGWLLDLKTGRMQKVLPDPTAEEFTWSPDGRRVAYHSRRSGSWGVRVLDAGTLGAPAR